MSVVVDASLLVAALVDGGEDGRWAEGILASGTLIAPQLAPVPLATLDRRLAAAPGSLCRFLLP